MSQFHFVKMCEFGYYAQYTPDYFDPEKRSGTTWRRNYALCSRLKDFITLFKDDVVNLSVDISTRKLRVKIGIAMCTSFSNVRNDLHDLVGNAP